MHVLRNDIRAYAWGSHTALPELLGLQPSSRPQAEMWLGAHPDSSSATDDGRSLAQLVDAQPVPMLGADVHRRFRRLPYLLKVLAAAQPLSLQVHPSDQQAQAGFAAEEAAGVPRDARHRRYKDPYHKPEMLIAVTEFEALCGLRRPEDAFRVMSGLEVDHPRWQVLLAALRTGTGGIGTVFRDLLRDPDPTLVHPLARAAHARRTTGSAHDAAYTTVIDLATAFPDDMGVALSLLLNRVTLAPGEALFLPAGNVHAYLHGTAVEIMASSDNVLRCGLTSKFVDVEELLRIVDFTPLPVPWVRPLQMATGGQAQVLRYAPAVDEFGIDMLQVAGTCTAPSLTGPRILLVLDGGLLVSTQHGSTHVGRGGSVFVADDEGPITVSGSGRAVLASVPVGSQQTVPVPAPSLPVGG
ncbi:MAG: mannose-6-phosphate isomerase, class I [Micrococcales bacterium]|nr:MAG: mannose-6-phosphate isomerase, class I [Micrococcales bacterium]PIE27816.1 MAG: mannose-6-phosphate isomerase, class I [Micrococcales bacterium]